MKHNELLDGVWFQSIEEKLGMDKAMYHDERAWERFTCECVSCYPDITDDTCCCKWKFILNI